jgi:hypothetical protein
MVNRYYVRCRGWRDKAKEDGGKPAEACRVWHLRILTGLWGDLKLGYEYQVAWPLLLGAANQELFRLTVDGVTAYDWQAQVIHLTQTASDALADTLVRTPRSVPGNLTYSLGWEVAVASTLNHRAFLVYLDETACYGGVFLDAMSQMAVSYPVMRCLHSPQEPLRLSILPLQIPFVQTDPDTTDPVVPGYAADEIEQLPGWRNWVAGLAATDKALEMRCRIRDPRVRALFEEHGKLR